MKKSVFKIIFDIIMTVLILLLMVYSLTGGYIHEVLGIAVSVMFVLHKIFNVKWIKAVTKKIVNSECDALTSAKYIADIVLLFLFIMTGFSGILVSNDILEQISANDRPLWVYIHNLSAYSLFIVISVHIGLHWSFIMAAFRKILKLKNDNAIRKTVLRICAFVLAVLGVRAHIDKDFTEHFVPEKTDEKSENQKLPEAYTENTDINTEYLSQPLIQEQRRNIRDDAAAVTPVVNEDDTPTLEEYLDRFYCTGCGKHCSLAAPRCGKGEANAEKAAEEYNRLYAPQDNEENIIQDESKDEIIPEDNEDIDDMQEKSDPQSIKETEPSVNQEETPEISSDENIYDEIPTLEEYLSKLYCTGCGKHCPLSSPQCGKGRTKAQQAEEEYNALYASQLNKPEENTSQNEETKSDDSNAETTAGTTDTKENLQSDDTENTPDSTDNENEIIFESDSPDDLRKIFTTMIPIMSLYIGGTHYVIKFLKWKK